MFRDMRDRLEHVAGEDLKREEELGRGCPSFLTFHLVGGTVLDRCWLTDSVNSVDEQSIDVQRFADMPDAEGAICWTIAIAHIAAIQQTFPSQARLDGKKSHLKGEW